MEAFLAEIYTTGTTACGSSARIQSVDPRAHQIGRPTKPQQKRGAVPKTYGPGDDPRARATERKNPNRNFGSPSSSAALRVYRSFRFRRICKVSTGLAEFHKAVPGSSLDVGVAEANMISTAIGLSLSGYIPIVDTFAQFGVTKGALPLTMGSLSMGTGHRRVLAYGFSRCGRWSLSPGDQASSRKFPRFPTLKFTRFQQAAKPKPS